MSYTLIEGTYRAVGFSPDGDSLRFAPKDVDLVNYLAGASVTLLAGKSIQLRLQCIDALETHYTSGSPRFRNQPMAQAMAAREKLLTLLGFSEIAWTQNQMDVASVKKDDQPGYILSNCFDSYGTRPVAYAFAGKRPPGTQDGEDIFLTANELGRSANWQMVRDGFAYPMYYEGAFHDLRAKFNEAVTAARDAQTAGGIWAKDVTTRGFDVPPDNTLTDKYALWPKLFRRVSSFFKENPTDSLAEFPAWLGANRDRCIDLDTGSWTALHNFVTWDGNEIKMTKDITRLMFEG